MVFGDETCSWMIAESLLRMRFTVVGVTDLSHSGSASRRLRLGSVSSSVYYFVRALT